MKIVKQFWRWLVLHRVIAFLAVGGSGALIQLFVSWLLVTYLFGVENYFPGYIIGLSCAILYDFILHTIVTFKSKSHHYKRLLGFVIYNIFLATLQIFLVSFFVSVVGNKYYLLVQIGIIGFLAAMSYLFYRLHLFNDAFWKKVFK